MTRNQRHTVGIFSRDVEDNYKWLINLLRTRLFQSVVEVVLPVCISNTGRSFVTGLDESSFAILYHTKKRGRLNIASVTDSLYDEELEDLSRRLGRSNVIVLVDDLEDISDNMRRMLQEQGLDMYVCEVILVSGREKELSNLSGPDTRLSQSPITASMQDVCSSLHEKLVNLKGIMEHAPHHNTGDSDSVVLSTDGFRSRDDDSVRSSHQSGSGMHSRLIPSLDHSVTSDPRGEDQIPRNHPDGQDERKRKKEKMVFGIIGALIALLVIVLIVILSVTL